MLFHCNSSYCTVILNTVLYSLRCVNEVCSGVRKSWYVCCYNYHHNIISWQGTYLLMLSPWMLSCCSWTLVYALTHAHTHIVGVRLYQYQCVLCTQGSGVGFWMETIKVCGFTHPWYNPCYWCVWDGSSAKMLQT